METLLGFYRIGRESGSFDSGIQRAVARVLVDPNFLFRFEREPADRRTPLPAAFRITDLELASRLSFFLWSSVPDDELRDAAVRGQLKNPAVLERQVRRLLADPRADALVNNFAGQWLFLRELKNVRPDSPDFDENLRRSFQQETELLFRTIVREDRPIIDLLDADFTFVDERLAKHYGMEGIRGSRVRRVPLAANDPRRGLLGHGSVLTVTSAANRTSPVVRGKWVLDNLLGMPPPQPPPGVETNLEKDAAQVKVTSLRQRLEMHRANAVCASCHKVMDPIGLTLENFDHVGKWRTADGKAPIDATAQLVDGTKLDGPLSLRRALLERSDVFATVATEKLLTYASGRAVQYQDMPAVRAIIRDAARDKYRFSSLVLGIVKSTPFQMRTKAEQEKPMTFITKRHLSRRTFLHGMGVSMALPLLDSMIPAQTALRLTAATPRNRFACVYVPHGATMDKWTPATEGSGFAFTEILKPLEPFRDRVNIVSGLAHPYVAGAGGADVSAGANHTRAAAVFLTGSVPERGPQAHLGTSVDQVAARQIGQDTPLPSLELSIEEAVLACEASFSCAYRNSISWQSPSSPLPMENNPRLVFEKLFGTGSTDAERRARRQESRSLLDSVMGQVASLQKDLPAGDRRRLTQYLDDVREIERRIQRAEKSVPDDLTVPEVPAGVPPTFQEHLKLLMDLQVIAFQAEITRVSTLMFARELSTAVFPETTIRDPFHNLSHHSNDRSNMDRFAQLNTYHMTKFAYLVERLQKTPDGDGTLLDHSVVLYGSSLSDGNQHNFSPLPIVLAGGASGRLKGGRHLVFQKDTHMSNLLLALLDTLAVNAESFGDSTGMLSI